MQKLPASAGWSWIKEGIALVRKQPVELLTLFMAYMLLMLVLVSIPLVGQIAAYILTPLFTMTFMQACVEVENGRRASLQLLLVGFKSPRSRTLLLLGLFYVVAALIASAVLVAIDKDTLLKLAEGKITIGSQEFRESRVPFAVLVSAALYTPAAMAFWYAAPLIAWKEMKIGKALFYSFFAVIKASKAFLIYGLGLTGIFLGALVAASILSILAGGNPLAARMISLPLVVLLFLVLYCSYYPNYADIFGKQQDPADTAPPPAGQ